MRQIDQFPTHFTHSTSHPRSVNRRDRTLISVVSQLNTDPAATDRSRISISLSVQAKPNFSYTLQLAHSCTTVPCAPGGAQVECRRQDFLKLLRAKDAAQRARADDHRSWQCPRRRIPDWIPFHKRAARGVVICAVESAPHDECRLAIVKAQALKLLPAARRQREALLDAALVTARVACISSISLAKASFCCSISSDALLMLSARVWSDCIRIIASKTLVVQPDEQPDEQPAAGTPGAQRARAHTANRQRARQIGTHERAPWQGTACMDRYARMQRHERRGHAGGERNGYRTAFEVANLFDGVWWKWPLPAQPRREQPA